MLDRIWQLRDNLSACDAVYVALAEALRTVLLTGDRKLAGAQEVTAEGSPMQCPSAGKREVAVDERNDARARRLEVASARSGDSEDSSPPVESGAGCLLIP